MAASEIEKLERLVRENPKGRQFAILADAFRKDGQYQRALDVLGPGLEVHPDYVSARVVLGRVLMAMGDSAKAKAAFTRVVELDPESVIALKALADLAEEAGDGPEALQRASQLLTVDPGNEEAQKQVERLSSTGTPAVADGGGSDAAPLPIAEVPDTIRLSGIVPTMPDEIPPPPPAAEKTAPPFAAVKPPVVKTVEIPVIDTSALTPAPAAPPSRPSFTAAPAPLDQAPEPLPLVPLSDEAQADQIAGSVQALGGLETTAFEGPTSDTPTQKLAGLDPTGMSEEDIKSIPSASGFEPTSGDVDTTQIPRVSMAGLESISVTAEENAQAAAQADDIGLEREADISIGASATNEFQESSAAETLSRRSGANEFQDSSVAETLQTSGGANEFQGASDGDLLDAGAAGAGDAMETGGQDLALIMPPEEPEPAPYVAPQAPVFTPTPVVPEDPEPAMTEPEPVVTESMAELYASQGHLAEALAVYRQLAERDPTGSRYAERIVELEMFVGTGDGMEAPAASDHSAPMEEYAPPMPEPVMPTIDAPAVGGGRWDAGTTGGTPVGSWLAEVFASSLSAGGPAMAPAVAAPMAAPEPMDVPESSAPLPLIMPPDEPAVDHAAHDLATPPPAAPAGKPTRPASGTFNLTNVFGETPPGAPSAKAGSFDDFFGAPAASAPAPAPAPGAPSIRTSRSTPAETGSPDDLSSFQDWLKGLKK